MPQALIAGNMFDDEKKKKPFLGGALNGSGAKPLIGANMGESPALRSVDPARETVSGQLRDITAEGSPLITQSETAAKQDANARGLLNSSMAVEAGRGAVYRTALPIAAADADVYGTAARENQAAQNQFGLTREQGAQTRLTQAQGGDIETGLIGARGQEQRTTDSQQQAAQRELTQLQGQITSQLQGEQAGQAESLATLRGQIDTGLQELRGGQAESLANIEANNRLLMQSSASASQFFSQTMESISAILNNRDLDVVQRQAAVDHQLSLLNAGLSVLGGAGNIDLSALLDFGATGGAAPGAAAIPTLPEGLGRGTGSDIAVMDKQFPGFENFISSAVGFVLRDVPDFAKRKLRDGLADGITAKAINDPQMLALVLRHIQNPQEVTIEQILGGLK